MYSEWASLSAQITANSCGAQCFSVLNKFPASAGREVVVSVVKQLGTNLGITQNAEPSHLVKDEEVKWCMDVICFGLSLPLQEHETIKDCVNVYCEWLTALHPQPRISVPKPICEDANLYARQIINHFHNLFVPRQGEILPFLYQTTLGADTIKRQAVLCHRVLRTLQQTAQISLVMDRQTWDTLLLFLLAINEILLAPPTVKDDVGDQLCERVLSVLFEVWLLACVRSFPSPSMWKTLQESCAMWRHRVALVDQWNRVNLALTARLLEFCYGPAFPQLKNADEDGQLIPAGMSNDCVAQTWYRFLRMIGNPTALCSPHIISKSSHFVQWALTHEKGAETHQHPCLQQLPQIFLNAMKGISSQVDAFLGIYQPPPQQHEGVVTNLLEIRHSLNEATSSTLQQFIHSSSATNIANPPTQHHHHHLHYPHLHLHGAGSFLRDNFMSSSASSALNAIMGHHGHGHAHGHHGHGQHQNLQISASPTGSLATTASAVGSTSAGGSHSAGVVGSISFGAPDGVGPASSASATPTPPLQRRLAKSFSVTPTITQQKGLSKTSLIGLTGGGARNAISSSTTTIAASGSTSAAGSGGGSAPAPAPTTPTSTSGPPSASSSINSLPLTSMGAGTELAVARPKCNSILHVFHEWLFEAAHIGGDTWRQNRKKQACEASKRPSSMIMEHRKGSISLSQPNSLNDPQSLPPTLTIDKYESGRAEAIGTLCKIFCAKKTGEEILPVYLARFYMALQQCLKITESRECDETLASILLHSSDLFRLDLDGINVLLPGFIAALEIVLPDKDLKLKTQSMAFNRTELRRSAINILLSIMVLPLHYQSLPIRDLTSETSEKIFTFIQLKSRLMNILMNALQVETDAQNTHMLLGGLLLCVQDAVTFEETELGGGNASTAHLSHNSSGGAVQHHEANLLSSDNAHALFVRATYLVCHRLISSWKTDLNVSLAALELLSGLARLHIRETAFQSGQTSAQQIIGNLTEEQHSLSLDPHFATMLQTLGWPVQVAEHSGWTGFAHNSWSLKGTPEEQLRTGPVANDSLNFNGSQKVLYWADVCSEIAFVVPTAWNLRHNSDSSDGGSVSSADQVSGSSNVWARGDGDTGLAKTKSRNLSLELSAAKEPVPPTRRKGNVTKPTLLAQAPAKIFLVWLESYEDYLNFPLEDLLAYTRTGEELHTLQLPRAADCHVIFVHSLLSGLLRVKLQGPAGRMSFATPLVDGMVLSRRVVGNLVRQTALNISRRRRLDNDNYQPPHVRRRLKVQDIVQKYKMDLSEAELLAHLFQRAI
ncbi:uncharacterized protein Dana_GF19204 [Drosophila ananassae]|uniref:Ral GTPase-activating protein subunit alpha/beta N-terminal domain-containing protein n=1 Tax=Drosophila ananassae TaxID=7217 RepID=B3MZL9_DROAN|nr:uncharacterized protein Dana_GF19204 [Drosophila ananassae]